ncbi:MAG: AN1-type zinc finger domain-containing protein, partial [Halobacteriaceae archaeon]
MARCDRCGEDESMPYRCRMCGETFCSEHRLPENHDCPGLDDWGDPGGVFDSGFDDSVTNSGGSGGFANRLGIDTGAGGALAYLRGNVTYLFLALMGMTFIAQFIALPLAGIPVGSATWSSIFVLRANRVLYLWTWVTSIFAHAG